VRHDDYSVAAILMVMMVVVMMVVMPGSPSHYDRCGVMVMMVMADLNADLSHLLRRRPLREPRVVGLQPRQRIRDRIEQVPVARCRRKLRRLRRHRLNGADGCQGGGGAQ